MATIDAVLAATAPAYDLTMVARNVSDFQQAGISVHGSFSQW